MRKFALMIPFALCGLALFFSATAEPYTVAAEITWVLTWASIISAILVYGSFFGGLLWQSDDGGDEPVTFSYYWQDKGEDLRVSVSNESGGLEIFPPERVPTAWYNRAVRVINKGAPACRGNEIPYKTEVTVKGGHVVEVVDGFYDMRPQQADGLFDLFCKEFNGPPVVWRKR